MSDKSDQPTNKKAFEYRQFFQKAWKMISYRWGWKVTSFVLALLLWGGLITQDASLTREKNFPNVTVNIVNSENLIRNGLIVTEGLKDLPPIRMRVEVPQKVYNSVTAASYNVRVDLSRITNPGKQTIPISYTSTSIYGTVTSLSIGEVEVMVDEYITRRRIPVQLNEIGNIPSGFYATTPNVDPTMVTLSGPKSVIKDIVRCVASYNTSLLSPAARTQYNAVPFLLYDQEGKEVRSDLITVTSESVILDTLLVEQTLFRLQPIAINSSAITTGAPAPGYHVESIKIDPPMLDIAGSEELMETLSMLDVATPIDISGAKETLIRSVKITKPDEVYHMSGNAVYVTVNIVPDEMTEGSAR